MNVFQSSFRFRPVRIGWCLQQNDWDAYRETLGRNFILAGGQFNPLIPIDDEDYAHALIRAFRVDILLSVTESAKMNAFIERFPHLRPPSLNREFWDSFQGSRVPHFIDISHPIRKHFELLYKNSPDYQLLRFDWQLDDPLADIFLATYGKFPCSSPKEMNYLDLLIGLGVSVKSKLITPNDPFPVILRDPFTFAPRYFCRLGVQQHYSYRNRWQYDGFYIGHANNFQDVVNFCNLQAADVSVIFYDPSHTDRLQERAQNWISIHTSFSKGITSNTSPLGLWGQNLDMLSEEAKWISPANLCKMDAVSWNGANNRVPYMYFSEHQIMGIQSTSSSGKPRISIQPPAHPFDNDVLLQGQQMVVAIQPSLDQLIDHTTTLQLPFVPELNPYYDRTCHFGVGLSCTRVEPDGIGFIKSVNYHSLSLQPINVTELLSNLFTLYGLQVTLSDAGLTTQRLIHQMGGLHQCRLFKIKGVRDLIKRFGPTKAFTWGDAVAVIRDQDEKNKKCSLDNYSHVYVNARKLNADAIMEFFLEKRIFSAGLELQCPNCLLKFWAADRLPHPQTCEYCLHTFNIQPFFKRSGIWHYRPSGLFAKGDDPKKGGDQKGAIPTILTLQQLEHELGWGKMPYCASAECTGVKQWKCESDFIAILPNPNDEGKIELIIAECKSKQDITDEDVQKLGTLANSFPKDQFQVYIVFSKLTNFSPEELNRILSLNLLNIQCIILSTRELEELNIYNTLLKEHGQQTWSGKLHRMAQITETLILSDRIAGYPPNK